jgi:hypothetical protein
MSSVKLALASQAHSINQYKKQNRNTLNVQILTLYGCVSFKCLSVPLICGGNNFKGELHKLRALFHHSMLTAY